MDKVNSLLEVIIDTDGCGGRPRYTLYYTNEKGEPVTVLLPIGFWNKSSIVNELVRSVYSQDHVEAIINNHFINIAKWLDKKFQGEEVEFVDEEYTKLQNWRQICKKIADEALAKYPAIN